MEAIYDDHGFIINVYDPALHRHEGMRTAVLTEEQAENPSAYRVNTVTGAVYQYPACDDPLFVKVIDGQVVELTEEEKQEVIAKRKQYEVERQEEEIKFRLREIDIASVRAIREYLVTLGDAPDYLKQHEASAVAERVSLRALLGEANQ